MLHTSQSRTSGRLGRIENLEKRELFAADLMAAPALGAPAAAIESEVVQVATFSGLESDALSIPGLAGGMQNGVTADENGKGCTEHDMHWLGSGPVWTRPSVPQGPIAETSTDRSTELWGEREDTLAVSAIDSTLTDDYGEDLKDSNGDGDIAEGIFKDICNMFGKRRMNKNGIYSRKIRG